MKQQWNSNETAMKQHETAWNSNETAMKQHETAMKQHETAMKQHEQRSETPWTKNRYTKIDISVVSVPDSRCFIGMKQRVSRPWNKLFHPDSRCFISMKQCFILIQGVSWPCFTLIQHVSRCFTTLKQIVSLLIYPDSTCFTVFYDHETNSFTADSSWFNMFHHCFIALINPVSCF